MMACILLDTSTPKVLDKNNNVLLCTYLNYLHVSFDLRKKVICDVAIVKTVLAD